ncbi:MAG: hypothetical protein L0H96_03120 [Humibacillus sp.]|nr:hypothetical protein [Humibacillus sp.]MDN5775883.1 hypothetical protein [Humibacillus sp.]
MRRIANCLFVAALLGTGPAVITAGSAAAAGTHLTQQHPVSVVDDIVDPITE